MADLLLNRAQRRALRHGGIRGMVPAAEALPGGVQVRLIPWNQAATIPINGRGGPEKRNPLNDAGDVPDDVVERFRAGLSPVVRTPAQAKFRRLVAELTAVGVRTQRAYGHPVWPKSLQDDLKVLGWKEGNPNLYGQVEALARKYMNEGARQQAALDAKRVTRDWHGHLSA